MRRQQRASRRGFGLWALLALWVVLAAGCGGDSVHLRKQLSELRRLQTNLQDQWADTRQSLADTEALMDELEPSQAQDAQRLATLRLALLQCFSSPIGEAEEKALLPPTRGAKPPPGQETEPAQAEPPDAPLPAPEDPAQVPCDTVAGIWLLEQPLSPEQRARLRAQLWQVARVKLSLRRDLPQRARDLASRYAEARNRAQEIALDADIARAQFDEKGLLVRSNSQDFRDEYNALQRELLNLEGLLDVLAQEALPVPDLLRAMTEDFVQKLTTLGAPPPPEPLPQ